MDRYHPRASCAQRTRLAKRFDRCGVGFAITPGRLSEEPYIPSNFWAAIVFYFRKWQLLTEYILILRTIVQKRRGEHTLTCNAYPQQPLDNAAWMVDVGFAGVCSVDALVILRGHHECSSYNVFVSKIELKLSGHYAP